MTEITGGCQCGAVRFTIHQPLGGFGICHCRMCQRATGNAFAPLVSARSVEWHGEPARWASSDIADRGFCGTCGTPLFYDPHASDDIEIMVGALDDPDQVKPRRHNGVESWVAWLHIDDGLPREETSTPGAEGGGPETIRSNQFRAPCAKETG